MHGIPTRTKGASPRVRWRSITLAMMAALVVYGGMLLVFRFANVMPTPPPPAASARLALLAAGALLLAGAVGWMLTMLPTAPKETHERTALEAEGRRFLARSVVASALAEASGLAGFALALLGGSLTEAVALIGLSLVMQATLLMPRGEAFWREWEARRPGPTQ